MTTTKGPKDDPKKKPAPEPAPPPPDASKEARAPRFAPGPEGVTVSDGTVTL